MKLIILTKNKFAIVDDTDFKQLNQWKWYCDTEGYARRNSPTINGTRKSIKMHRQIMNSPVGREIDHINRDRLDNRRHNLRIVTRLENMNNKGMYKNNTTGYLGVSRTTQRVSYKDRVYVYKKWAAQVNFNGKVFKQYCLTKEAAILAVNSIKKRLDLLQWERKSS